MLLDDDRREPLLAEQRASAPRSSSSTMIGASPSVGSSSSSRRGLVASARPIASICCSPPDSELPDCWARSSRRGNSPNTRSMRPRSRPRDGREVLLHGERAEDVALLRHPADAQPGAHLRRQRADLAAAERDRSGEAARHADQRVEQRRLAGAVAAQQRQRLALAQAEGHVGQHDGAAVARGQVLDGQQVSHRGSRRDRRRARADRRRSPPARLRPAGRRRPAP